METARAPQLFRAWGLPIDGETTSWGWVDTVDILGYDGICTSIVGVDEQQIDLRTQDTDYSQVNNLCNMDETGWTKMVLHQTSIIIYHHSIFTDLGVCSSWWFQPL